MPGSGGWGIRRRGQCVRFAPPAQAHPGVHPAEALDHTELWGSAVLTALLMGDSAVSRL